MLEALRQTAASASDGAALHLQHNAPESASDLGRVIHLKPDRILLALSP